MTDSGPNRFVELLQKPRERPDVSAILEPLRELVTAFHELGVGARLVEQGCHYLLLLHPAYRPGLASGWLYFTLMPQGISTSITKGGVLTCYTVKTATEMRKLLEECVQTDFAQEKLVQLREQATREVEAFLYFGAMVVGRRRIRVSAQDQEQLARAEGGGVDVLLAEGECMPERDPVRLSSAGLEFRVTSHRELADHKLWLNLEPTPTYWKLVHGAAVLYRSDVNARSSCF